MGPRDLNKEPPHRHHEPHRKPYGADRSRKNSLDDKGMKAFVDSIEGMNIGARKNSTRVSPEDHKGRAKRGDKIGEDKEVQDKKNPAKDDKYGGRRHGEMRHKEHAREDRKHKDREHQEHLPRDHRNKERPDGDRRHKEQQRREDRQEKRPDREYRQEKHPNRDYRHKSPHKPHPLTEKEFNQKIYSSALLPFHRNSGTPYKTSQSEIDFHRHGVFKTPNTGPFVTRMQAAHEILRWNDEKRAPPGDELELIRQLAIAVHDAEKNALFSPDIVVKAFADLDRVFFCGKLRGNVAVKWVEDIKNGHDEKDGGTYGDTKPNRTGQCRIRLNAKAILLQRWSKVGKNSVACMFGTLLHEMCHAYDFVRCPKQKIGVDGHDEIWQTMIGVIHDRCRRILGTVSLLFRRVVCPLFVMF